MTLSPLHLLLVFCFWWHNPTHGQVRAKPAQAQFTPLNFSNLERSLREKESAYQQNQHYLNNVRQWIYDLKKQTSDIIFNNKATDLLYELDKIENRDLSQSYYDIKYVESQVQNAISDHNNRISNHGSSSESRISCSEAMKMIISEGIKIGSVEGFSLMYSKFLNKVSAYQITTDDQPVIFVVAEIRRENSFNTDKYLFCHVPKSDWESFANEMYYVINNVSYDEGFHQFIIHHKCNCQ